MWQYKKAIGTVKGTKKELDLEGIKKFLKEGYFTPPFTVFKQFREVVIDGDIGLKSDTFPEMLIEQNPNQKFALHLSGGFDSSILAKLYDREDSLYVHIGTKEYPKAKALVDTLKGKLVRFDVSDEEWLKTIEEILPKYAEPECDPACAFAYLASKKAKELGYELIISGDMSDTILGGHNWGDDSEPAMDMWKTLEPNRLLGLKTLLPFGHPKLKEWVANNLKPHQVGWDKLFLREYCRKLNLPKEVTEQKKEGWSGCWDFLTNTKIMGYLKEVINKSDYEFKDYPVNGNGLFRKYSLVKWLEANKK